MSSGYFFSRSSVIRAVLTFAALVAVMALSPEVLAEGKLRDRIRERMNERQRSQGSASKDVRQSGSLQEVTLEHDGRTRTYLVYVPESYQVSAPVPLVLAFHGGGGGQHIMSKDEYYGWISKSEKEGFIVVFPNGTSAFRKGILSTWNAGSCCGYARDKKVDDVGFVRSLLGDIKGRFNIDEKRIFATGMSNGGMFSYTLACTMADVFKAIASVTGTDGNAVCQPRNAISILHIHAKDDTHVLFNGGAGKDAFKDPSTVTEFVSVPATINMWVKRNSCQPEAQRILDVTGAYCEMYGSCEGQTQVQLCVTETGGHSWPGAKATPLKKEILPSQALNATDVIWDFFRSQN